MNTLSFAMVVQGKKVIKYLTDSVLLNLTVGEFIEFSNYIEPEKLWKLHEEAVKNNQKPDFKLGYFD